MPRGKVHCPSAVALGGVEGRSKSEIVTHGPAKRYRPDSNVMSRRGRCTSAEANAAGAEVFDRES